MNLVLNNMHKIGFTKFWRALFLLLFLLSSTAAQAGEKISLPPEIQARRFVRAMGDAVQENDHAKVVSLCEEMLGQDDFELDPGFRFYFARSLAAVGRQDDALRELEIFFNAPGMDEDLVDEALSILDRLEKNRNLPPKEEIRKRRDALLALLTMFETRGIFAVADGVLPGGSTGVVVTDASSGSTFANGFVLLLRDSTTGDSLAVSSVEHLVNELAARLAAHHTMDITAGGSGTATTAFDADAGATDLDLPLAGISTKKRAWLGLQMEAIAPGKELPDGGVMVEKVQPLSDGKTSGLRPGDLILALDDKDIGSVTDMQIAVAGVWPRETVRLRVLRDGQTMTVNAPVEQRHAVIERQRREEEAARRRQEEAQQAERRRQEEARQQEAARKKAEEEKRIADEKLRKERETGTAVVRTAKICDFNAKENGIDGFLFHLDFSVNYRQNQDVQVMILLYQADGAQPQKIGVPHPGWWCSYHTTKDQICTAKTVKPGYEKTNFNEYHLFLPCAFFGSGHKHFQFQVEISSAGTVLARSGMMDMQFQHKQHTGDY